MLEDVAGAGNIENVVSVATWHVPETFDRDNKFSAALSAIDAIKRQEITEKTPKKYIKPLMGNIKMVDNEWLAKPLVDWLNGKATDIILASWVLKADST